MSTADWESAPAEHRLDPATTPRDERHLRAVGDAQATLEEARARLQDAVQAARNAGDSWTAIASALGSSERYARLTFATRMARNAPETVPSDPASTASSAGEEGEGIREVLLSEARTRLGELLTEADRDEVVLLEHGRPAAALVSFRVWERALDRIEDLEDQLSVLLPSDTVPFVRTTEPDDDATD